MTLTSINTRLADDKFSEHARWVGIALANSAVLESELEFLYSQVLGLDWLQSKIAFYAIQSHIARINTISSAIHEFFPDTEVETEWKNLLPSIKNANKKRIQG